MGAWRAHGSCVPEGQPSLQSTALACCLAALLPLQAVAAEALAEFEAEERTHKMQQGLACANPAAASAGIGAEQAEQDREGEHVAPALGSAPENPTRGDGLPHEGNAPTAAAAHSRGASLQHTGPADELGAEPSVPRIQTWDLPAACGTDEGAAATRGERAV